jgi:hypothetical protein
MPHIQFDGALEANAVGNFNSPADGAAQSLGFLGYSNQLRLTEATLSVAADWGRTGFRLDGGAGDFYKVAMSADAWKGPNSYISQAYFIWRPKGQIRIEAGKFFSSVGAELPQSYDNFNVTNSQLFWYAEPLYHIGLRASTPIGGGFTAGAQLLSGSNTVTGSHGHQTEALTAGWSGKHWGWSEIYMDGNEKLEGRGRRHLSDTVLNFNFSRAVTGYAEAIVAVEKRVSPGYDRWYGWATAWRFSPTERWCFSPRVDWLNDVDGATTGQSQRLFEFTVTGEYHPRKFMIARLEYRDDFSSRLFYQRAAGLPRSNRQEVVVASLVLVLHRELKLRGR